jgi:hypothetical protein
LISDEEEQLMRKVFAATGIALAGLLFGVGLGRASVTASGPPPAAPALVEQTVPDGLLRVVDDDSDGNCHEDDTDAANTQQRSA